MALIRFRFPGSPGIRKQASAAAVAAILAAALYVHRGAFTGFFVQDDYGWLESSRFTSFGEYAAIFFRFNPALTYRPLSQETFFFLGQKAFGLWPPGYHFMSLALFLTASALVYLLARRFCPVLPSLVGTFFFALHSAQMRSVHWISAVPEPMALVFILSSLLLFIRFDSGRGHAAYFLSLAAMVLGMMSKESTLTLPLALAAYCLFFSRSRLLWTGPFFLISLVYTVLRLTSDAVRAAPYPLTFGSEALGNLAAYLSWSAGFTETFLKVKLGLDAEAAYPAVAIACAMMLGTLLWLARDRKVAAFALIWCAAALQPVLYFWQHIDPYYLAPSISALALFLAAALPAPRGLRDLRALLPAAAVISYTLWFAPVSIRLEGRWWNERSLVGKRILDQMPAVDQQVPDGRIAYVFGLSALDLGILQNDSAFKAFGISPTKYILIGLDADTPRQIRTLQRNEGIRDYYCFLYVRGELHNMTAEFRRNPEHFLVPAGLRITPPEIRAGKDSMTIETVNFDVPMVDLLCTLNGKPVPPVTYWQLDLGRASVFVDHATPRGLYHFTAMRDSRFPDPDRWIPIDIRVMVR